MIASSLQRENDGLMTADRFILLSKGKCAGTDALFARLGRIEQAVEVRHKIAHMGVVYGRQRLGFPGLMRRGVIRKHADDVDVVEIAELGPVEIDEFASENKMKELFAAVIRHADKLGFH